MILFTVLLITLLALAIMALLTAAVGGTVLFALFGDLIIFVLMVVIIAKLIKKIRKK